MSIIRLILKRKNNKKNENALMIAIGNGNKKIANLLLEAGSDIEYGIM